MCLSLSSSELKDRTPEKTEWQKTVIRHNSSIRNGIKVSSSSSSPSSSSKLLTRFTLWNVFSEVFGLRQAHFTLQPGITTAIKKGITTITTTTINWLSKWKGGKQQQHCRSEHRCTFRALSCALLRRLSCRQHQVTQRRCLRLSLSLSLSFSVFFMTPAAVECSAAVVKVTWIYTSQYCPNCLSVCRAVEKSR